MGIFQSSWTTVISLLIATNTLAHEGPHDDLQYLPAYKQEQQDGFASLKITQVASNYIVTLASPQHNFLGSNKEKLAKPLRKKKELTLKKLEDLNNLFNSKDFNCTKLIANVSPIQEHRVPEDGLKKKYKDKKVDLNKFIQPFVAFNGFYKIHCKKPIEPKNLNIKLMDLAPQMKSLSWQLKTKKHTVQNIITRKK